MYGIKFFVIICALFFSLGANQLLAQDLSLLGNTGLMVIPTADLQSDRTLSFGYTYVHSEEVRYNFSKWPFTEGSAARVVYANLAFLPFMEATVRLTRPYAGKEELGLGDRSIFLRFRLLKERKYLPAIAIGLHDLISSPGGYFQSNYLVASKRWGVEEKVYYQASGGYGFKWSDANQGYLLGLFGGVRADWKFLSAVVEYDAEQLNAGLKAHFFKRHIYLNVGFLQLKHLSIGLAANLRL
ncbi:MAG: YjbH domain-containing protein [Bacteroidota bacterium]